MTIAEFCLDHLRQHGPTTLTELTALAVAEGVTRARQPELSVRQALRESAVELPGERWAAPLALLEGRCLTTRASAWAEGPAWRYDTPVDRRPVDLAPLLPSLGKGIPLAEGGVLKLGPYGDSWRHPAQWPFVEPDPDLLVCLRAQSGVLHTSTAQLSPELLARGRALAELIGHLTGRRSPSYWDRSSGLTDAMVTRLWSSLVDDPALLLAPLPPLSLCIPQLREALATEDRERSARWHEEQSRWDVRLTLPAHLRCWAEDLAGRAGMSVEGWFQSVLLDTLGAQPEWSGDVLPFRHAR